MILQIIALAFRATGGDTNEVFVRFKKAFVSVTAIAVPLLLTGPAFSAQNDRAVERPVLGDANGQHEIHEGIVYFNSNYAGGMYDHSEDINYVGRSFMSWTDEQARKHTNGAGQTVKNNAASVANYDPKRVLRIHFNSGCKGRSQNVGGYKNYNLEKWLKNNNASQCWGG
ncbi:hypothetical protein [Streptomyces sp. NPDC058157]|uniref:hypothetical protein n=1 Tax=Streptomyces sp. NPDC058157 TaxID=3346360 RepID=UPI0036E2E7A2